MYKQCSMMTHFRSIQTSSYFSLTQDHFRFWKSLSSWTKLIVFYYVTCSYINFSISQDPSPPFSIDCKTSDYPQVYGFIYIQQVMRVTTPSPSIFYFTPGVSSTVGLFDP